MSSVNCAQRIPAGLPSGIPGIGDEMDIAIQHAPQPARHSIRFSLAYFRLRISIADIIHEDIRKYQFVVLFAKY